MSLAQPLVIDRSGLLGATAGLLAQLPPEAVYGYILARILAPVLLVALAVRGATPSQRIRLVTVYFTTTTHCSRCGRDGN